MHRPGRPRLCADAVSALCPRDRFGPGIPPRYWPMSLLPIWAIRVFGGPVALRRGPETVARRADADACHFGPSDGGLLCSSAEAKRLSLFLSVERQATAALLHQRGRGEFRRLPAIHDRRQDVRREKRQPDEPRSIGAADAFLRRQVSSPSTSRPWTFSHIARARRITRIIAGSVAGAATGSTPITIAISFPARRTRRSASRPSSTVRGLRTLSRRYR